MFNFIPLWAPPALFFAIMVVVLLVAVNRFVGLAYLSALLEEKTEEYDLKVLTHGVDSDIANDVLEEMKCITAEIVKKIPSAR